MSRTDHGGTGVRQTVSAVTTLDGYFYLASGGAATMVTGRRSTHSSGATFDGTIVEGRVPTRRAEGAQERHNGVMNGRADLYLPLFVAGRDFADHVADQLGDYPGEPIVVDATGLRSGTSSFAAQLVQRVLVDGKASELTVVGAPDEFARLPARCRRPRRRRRPAHDRARTSPNRRDRLTPVADRNAEPKASFIASQARQLLGVA